jgi:hypothetical protein
MHIIHPKILEWLREIPLDELHLFRKISMYFGLVPLDDACLVLLSIHIIKTPKMVFKAFHDKKLTLVSKDAVKAQFPVICT